MKLRHICTIFISLFSTMCFSQMEEWNLDFEEWEKLEPGTNLQDTIIQDHVAGYPSNWHFNPDNIPEGTGIGRTTDATMNEYAVTLSGFYLYQIMRITTGSDPNHTGWPINGSPELLAGDYKAILLGPTSDSLRAYIDVYLTKYNMTTTSRDTIGEGHLTLKESDVYRDFEVEIFYPDGFITADTVIIVLAKERFGFPLNGNECLECSHVYFDNLRLRNYITTTEEIVDEEEFDCYPNPVLNQLFIENKSSVEKAIYLFDVNGRMLRAVSVSPNGTQSIPVEEIGTNILFVSDGTSVRKVLISQ